LRDRGLALLTRVGRVLSPRRQAGLTYEAEESVGYMLTLLADTVVHRALQAVGARTAFSRASVIAALFVAAVRQAKTHSLGADILRARAFAARPLASIVATVLALALRHTNLIVACVNRFSRDVFHAVLEVELWLIYLRLAEFIDGLRVRSILFQPVRRHVYGIELLGLASLVRFGVLELEFGRSTVQAAGGQPTKNN